MNRWRFAVITIGGLLCLFVLAQIKTRSGFLVFSGTFLMCLLVSVWMPQLGRLKIVAIPILMLAATLSSLPFILEQGAGLLERFQGSYHTFEGRVDSLSYMLTNLGNPEFWIPQGNAAYVNRTGNVPHANPTAFYLEGGLLGVFSWFLLFPLPLMATGVHYFRRRLNPVQVMALIGGAACLVIQLSLNVPLMEQVWLWGGAVVGVVPRLPVAKASASGKVAMLCHR
ncbi:MAG: hypothetical protein QNJ22_04115, partial [Desulfosarcinaceae bacterium]|nr:hypothetical protein [Desulfosarcinaceae bacterium]